MAHLVTVYQSYEQKMIKHYSVHHGKKQIASGLDKETAHSIIAAFNNQERLSKELHNAVAAMDCMRTQIDQMRGMFPGDQAIEQACLEHDEADFAALQLLKELGL